MTNGVNEQVGEPDAGNDGKHAHFLDGAPVLRWSEVSCTVEHPCMLVTANWSICSLAIVQMRIHIGTILRNFTVELHPDTTPEVMRTVDNFQGKPAQDRVLLYFRRRA